MMEAVDHHPRISVVGCNSSGKDWMAARIMLRWHATHEPAKTIVTGPTHRQVDEIVWAEARSAYDGALMLSDYRMSRRAASMRMDDNNKAQGFATDKPLNLQGFHSPNLLVIITEAHSMSKAHIDALWRLNPSVMLMTGNPFCSSGPFFDTHHSRRARWFTIEISAYDTPNVQQGRTVVPGMVTQAVIDDRVEEWGEDSPLFIGSILGEFPDNLDETVVPLSAAMAATQRTYEPTGADERVLGVDVAREGPDKSVIVLRVGNQASIVWSGHERDVMKLTGRVGVACTRTRASRIVIDDTGIGGGVTDRLREIKNALSAEYEAMGGEDRRAFGHSLRNAKVMAFKAGGAALDKKDFANASAELWWVTRKWIMADGCIPDDRELVAQLTSRDYELQSDQTIKLESKDKMKKRGIPSPDKADALVMTFARGKGDFKVWT